MTPGQYLYSHVLDTLRIIALLKNLDLHQQWMVFSVTVARTAVDYYDKSENSEMGNVLVRKAEGTLRSAHPRQTTAPVGC
jgi:hypothetical protein